MTFVLFFLFSSLFQMQQNDLNVTQCKINYLFKSDSTSLGFLCY